MKKSVLLVIFICCLCACEKEHPNPDNFLFYDHPNFEFVNAEPLAILNNEIKNGVFGDLHSLIIIRNDKIIFENYYSGYRRSDLHPIRESTQSVVSTLVGAMLYENESLTLDTTIINFFPQYANYFDDIPQKDQIKIRHLLSNTSGFWWKEWNQSNGSNENDAYDMSQSSDWIAKILSTPMIQEPGTTFNINSGHGVLMAPIMESLTGLDLEAFAKEKLFDPLMITDWEWERIPGEYVNASWGLHLRPIDFAKIGYLYLKGGIWENHELFNENWLYRSTRYREQVSGYYGYGFFWWRFSNISDVISPLIQNDVFFSWGSGGQYLFIVPHLDLVIVMTAGNYGNSENAAFAILQEYIFPAIIDRFQ